jgi:hypothetical protein
MITQESDPSSILVPDIVDGLCDILFVARCHENKDSAKDLLLSKFRAELDTIVNSALQMNKAIGEDILSKDLEPMHEQPEVVFDAMVMDDAFPADESKVDDKHGIKTLCSTDLGLRSIEKVSREGESESEWHDSILLKPKVALESLLEAMGTNLPKPEWATVDL